jgi:hypothetical protein
MTSIKALIEELQGLQSDGAEFVEFVDENWNNYYFKEVVQSGAKDFGYVVVETENGL